MRIGRVGSPSLALIALLLASRAADAAPPANGAPLLRMLGSRAQAAIEPGKSSLGALVRVPSSGFDASAFGLTPYTPGFARLRGSADDLIAFGEAHPELPLEVAFPPHLLLDRVGQWIHANAARQEYGVDGSGVLIGVADTGVDFTLDDFNDPSTGKTRIAWLLDLTCVEADPGCPHPDNYPILENTYGGYVYSGADLDNLLGEGLVGAGSGWITDTVGHGTHVTSIAAGNGGLAKKYVGIAPGAGLVIARVTSDQASDIATDDLLTGVKFAFDMADMMGMPIAVNLSIGSDFGSHDGLMAWEEGLAGFVGPGYPGHALLVAAGNSGDIDLDQVHQSVYVTKGVTESVPIQSLYGGTLALGGQVEVWVTVRGGSNLAVGLDGPGGTWISPVGGSQTGSYPPGDSGSTCDNLCAGVYNGSTTYTSEIPSGSNSAIVIWEGNFAAGTYSITLSGEGVADLYVEGVGDAVDVNGNGVGFVDPVREGTINIPATNSGLIGVGCTVNRPSWTSIMGGFVSVELTPLDARGGYVDDAGAQYAPVSGDVCWFSSAGPTVTGVPKPEISAPGGVVIAAMSGWANPTVGTSIFENPDCPPLVDGGAPNAYCMQVDPTHAVAAGTSMSAPQAAGAVALLFQKDPSLTQDKIVSLLQAGAHYFRTGAPEFEDQGGPGELDVAGTLDAYDQMQDPALALPSGAASWITLSADEVTADGSTPFTAIVELRTADGVHRADYFDSTRLAPVMLLDGVPYSPAPSIVRHAPGVWTFSFTPGSGLGGSVMTFGATFDGSPIVAAKSVPVATDTWTASYPSSAGGGGSTCAVAAPGFEGKGASGVWLAPVAFVAIRRRERRSSRALRGGSRPGRRG